MGDGEGDGRLSRHPPAAAEVREVCPQHLHNHLVVESQVELLLVYELRGQQETSAALTPATKSLQCHPCLPTSAKPGQPQCAQEKCSFAPTAHPTLPGRCQYSLERDSQTSEQLLATNSYRGNSTVQQQQWHSGPTQPVCAVPIPSKSCFPQCQARSPACPHTMLHTRDRGIPACPSTSSWCPCQSKQRFSPNTDHQKADTISSQHTDSQDQLRCFKSWSWGSSILPVCSENNSSTQPVEKPLAQFPTT